MLEEPEQSLKNGQENKEKVATKFLFIDDNIGLLRGLQRAFAQNPNVIFAECRSVEDAFRAIAEHQPGIVFLDHHLSDFGDEGFEVAEKINQNIADSALAKRVKIYSTTSDTVAAQEYQKRGIENIRKSDLEKFKAIIAAK